jgi:hypothetical protein
MAWENQPPYAGNELEKDGTEGFLIKDDKSRCMENKNYRQLQLSGAANYL